MRKGRTIVADIAVNNISVRIIAVYTPKYQKELVSFFRRLRPFLVDSSRLVLIRDWYDILDTNIGRGARGMSGNRSLVWFDQRVLRRSLSEELDYAKNIVDIPLEYIDIILHWRKSILYHNGDTWVKKTSKDGFVVSHGSFDGAEFTSS